MNEVLDKGAIESVSALTRAAEKVEVVEIDGEKYYDSVHHNLHKIRDNAPAKITLSTLSGLAEIIKQERVRYKEKIFVYPLDVLTVMATTTLLHDLDRDDPYCATTRPPAFEYGRFVPLEEMLIALRSKFVRAGDVDYLCELLSSVTNADGIELQDDGMTQKVETKMGVSLKQMGVTRPIVRLAPYRTFIEVDQPQSDFLFRVKAQGNEVYAALFEADGGAWKNDAMNNVREYLNDALKGIGGVTVIA